MKQDKEEQPNIEKPKTKALKTAKIWLSEVWWVPIVVALIGLTGILLPAIVERIDRAPSTPQLDSNFDYAVRVQDKETGEPISNVKITIEVTGQAPLDEVTDSNGFARIFINASRTNQPARLIVQIIGYTRYIQNIDLEPDSLPDIVQLEPKTSDLETPTASPVPTYGPSPTPTCPEPVFFRDVWETHPQLGCPINSLTSDFTFQIFERGILAWQKSPSPSTIYAFFYDGRWGRQTDPGGPPEPSCPEAEQTGLGPIFGFGTVWCENGDWQKRLGIPTDTEKDGKNNQIQNFEYGTMLTIGTADGFILYSDSHWESF